MIEVKNLTKSYNGKDNILKGVTLEIPQNEFVVILGASGSGKSTLLNCISGLERPTGGKVIYGDVDITALTDAQLTRFRKDTIGFVFQQYYLIPTMTVEKNVRMCAELVGNKDYAEIIAAVGLKDKAKKYPSELSGGEQQRVSVARALAKNPKVLFLDEPTGALDEETGRQLLDYLCKLRGERGFTMIMVTHNQNIAETANTVIKMNSGNIVGISANKTVKTAYEIGW